MMRVDALKSHGCPIRMDMTAKKQIPTSHVYSTDESELKVFPVDKTLLQICSTDKDKSKVIIVDECYTKDDKYK